jgi:hypothetical protein
LWRRLKVEALIYANRNSVFRQEPVDELFIGFGHPAVITVAAVLVISQGQLRTCRWLIRGLTVSE